MKRRELLHPRCPRRVLFKAALLAGCLGYSRLMGVKRETSFEAMPLDQDFVDSYCEALGRMSYARHERLYFGQWVDPYEA